MTTLRAFMRAVAADPFLADQFRSNPDAVLEMYGLSAEARAALKTGDPESITRALTRGPTATANPWVSERVAAAGIGVFLWPGFLPQEDCERIRGELVSEKRTARERAGGRGQIAEELSVIEETVLDLVRRVSDVTPVIASHFNVAVTDCVRPTFLDVATKAPDEPGRDYADDAADPTKSRRRISLRIFLDGSNGVERRAPSEASDWDGFIFYRAHSETDTQRWGLRPTTGLLAAFRATTCYAVAAAESGEHFICESWLLAPT